MLHAMWICRALPRARAPSVYATSLECCRSMATSWIDTLRALFAPFCFAGKPFGKDDSFLRLAVEAGAAARAAAGAAPGALPLRLLFAAVGWPLLVAFFFFFFVLLLLGIKADSCASCASPFCMPSSNSTSSCVGTGSFELVNASSSWLCSAEDPTGLGSCSPWATCSVRVVISIFSTLTVAL